MSSFSNTYIALDIGGTKIYGGLYDQDLHLIKSLQLPTSSNKPAAFTFGNIKTIVQTLKDTSTKAVGISLAGFIDADQGIILEAPNIPSLDGFTLVERIKEECGLDAFLQNDAKLFALAEAHQKGPPLPKVSVGIIIGTGVGAGVVLNGNLYFGAHGSAGEVGHIHLNKQEIEKVIAGEGIKKIFQKQGWGQDVFQVQADMKRNKTPFKKGMEPFIDFFSEFLTAIIFTYDPDDIVLGGSVGIHFWSLWKDEILECTNKKLKPYPVECSLRISELENAGALGAALLAKQKYTQNEGAEWADKIQDNLS